MGIGEQPGTPSRALGADRGLQLGAGDLHQADPLGDDGGSDDPFGSPVGDRGPLLAGHRRLADGPLLGGFPSGQPGVVG